MQKNFSLDYSTSTQPFASLNFVQTHKSAQSAPCVCVSDVAKIYAPPWKSTFTVGVFFLKKKKEYGPQLAVFFNPRTIHFSNHEKEFMSLSTSLSVTP